MMDSDGFDAAVGGRRGGGATEDSNLSVMAAKHKERLAQKAMRDAKRELRESEMRLKLELARKVEEAERAGLVSRIVPAADLLDDAIATATTIAEMSLPIAMMAKEAVNRSYESTLAEGVRFERRLFHSTFATEDQKEGMAAFVDKRQPTFVNR